MAQATGPLSTAEDAAITLLYVRASAESDILGSRLALIAARYAPAVTLQIITPEQLPSRYADFAGPLPALLVLRRGEVVSAASGALPVRELDRVVHQAVAWPG